MPTEPPRTKSLLASFFSKEERKIFFKKWRQRTFILCAAIVFSAVTATARAGDSRVALMAAHRGGELRLTAYQPAGTIDPQINYISDFWQVYFVTQDELVTFRKAEGADGLQLVPDLAETMPDVSDGGRTYTFRLRPGIRFSTGQVLTATDVVTSYRRMFQVLGPNTGSWYSIIVGADACLKTPADCTLNGGIEGDTASGIVRIHLVRPDAEFLQKIALPFACILPADTPPRDLGTTPPATTGPYMFVGYNPVRELALARNPYFHQWSEAAQPDGFADRITYRYGLQAESEITAIENGALDWTPDPAPLDRLSEIGGEYTQLAHIDPMLAFYYVIMNTRLPPFTNADARRAVAMAVNRKVAVNLYGGPAMGTPLCQLLPKGIAGYVDYCPYTKNPGAEWHAPDLNAARALVDRSGTKGMAVTLVVSDREVERALGVYLQSVLADLGYQARVHSISYNIRDTYIENSSNKVQIGLSDWYQDYPSASDFLDVLLSCASFHPGSDASINMSEFCDPAVDAEMRQAEAAELTDTAAAVAQWTAIDKQLTDLAPFTTLFQINHLDLTAPRVGHFRFSPLFHFIFSEAWVQ
jgi:peptide/nickel transport system substrate-binding protein